MGRAIQKEFCATSAEGSTYRSVSQERLEIRVPPSPNLPTSGMIEFFA